MGASQRRKGHAWEREVARQLRESLGLSAEAIKRGLSQPRGGGAEEPDVVLPDTIPYWIECKVGKQTNPRAALRQAQADLTKAKSTKSPVAVCKDDRQEPFVVLTLDTFLQMVRALHGPR